MLDRDKISRFLTGAALLAAMLLVSGTATNCTIGMFGQPVCKKTCNCRFQLACDVHTGSCPFGCAKGWLGTDCQQRVCPEGFYSPPKCDQPCKCRVPNRCNPSSGHCMGHGCIKGWWGPKCSENVTTSKICNIGDTQCVPASMKACHCSDSRCTLTKGKCREGCQRGWLGRNCQTRACPEGRYGPPHCTGKCHCADKTICSPHDGSCQGTSCIPGWQGISCSKLVCPPMTFHFPGCKSYCFCAKDDRGIPTTCDVDSGSCDAGCMAGWKSPQCNKRLCPDNSYGYPDCSLDCKCSNNSYCNSLTGVCQEALSRSYQPSTPTPETEPVSTHLGTVVFAIALTTITVISCVGIFIVAALKTSERNDTQNIHASNVATAGPFTEQDSPSVTPPIIEEYPGASATTSVSVV